MGVRKGGEQNEQRAFVSSWKLGLRLKIFWKTCIQLQVWLYFTLRLSPSLQLNYLSVEPEHEKDRHMVRYYFWETFYKSSDHYVDD